MTLRDQFAMAAITAASAQSLADGGGFLQRNTMIDEAEIIAVWAYTIADAMLEERDCKA